jgi:hypothetical protein
MVVIGAARRRGELRRHSRLCGHEPVAQDRDAARADQPTGCDGNATGPAAAEHRRKVAGLGRLVCGRWPVDPAHAVPRRFGACDSPDCVVPLGRAHHRSFGTALLRLAPYLTPNFEGRIAQLVVHSLPGETAYGYDGK